MEPISPSWQTYIIKIATASGRGEIKDGVTWASFGVFEEAHEPRWNLTHLPTGFCIARTAEEKDARRIAEVIGAVTDFDAIKSMEDANPHMSKCRDAILADGFHFWGGNRFERFDLDS